MNRFLPKSLRARLVIGAAIHPLRDGTNGGQFLEIVLPDGTKLGQAVSAPR
jgi:hypothetical protein